MSQDCVLFGRSVRENIKYGYEEASDEEMHRAAKLASAHDFIMGLPNQYDTGSERDFLLSGWNWNGFSCYFKFLDACTENRTYACNDK